MEPRKLSRRQKEGKERREKEPTARAEKARAPGKEVYYLEPQTAGRSAMHSIARDAQTAHAPGHTSAGFGDAWAATQ